MKKVVRAPVCLLSMLSEELPLWLVRRPRGVPDFGAVRAWLVRHGPLLILQAPVLTGKWRGCW